MNQITRIKCMKTLYTHQSGGHIRTSHDFFRLSMVSNTLPQNSDKNKKKKFPVRLEHRTFGSLNRFHTTTPQTATWIRCDYLPIWKEVCYTAHPLCCSLKPTARRYQRRVANFAKLLRFHLMLVCIDIWSVSLYNLTRF